MPIWKQQTEIKRQPRTQIYNEKLWRHDNDRDHDDDDDDEKLKRTHQESSENTLSDRMRPLNIVNIDCYNTNISNV